MTSIVKKCKIMLENVNLLFISIAFSHRKPWANNFQTYKLNFWHKDTLWIPSIKWTKNVPVLFPAYLFSEVSSLHKHVLYLFSVPIEPMWESKIYGPCLFQHCLTVPEKVCQQGHPTAKPGTEILTWSFRKISIIVTMFAYTL